MSITPSDATARETIWRTACSSSSSGPRLGGGSLAQHRLDGLEERHVVADPHRVVVRYGERESSRQVTHGLHAALLAALLSQDVLLRRR